MGGLVIVKQALGVASIALGAAALISPRRFARLVGVAPEAGAAEAVAAFGSRQLGAGAALLSPVRFGPFLWFRLAGDLFDLGGLAVAARKPAANPRLLGLAAVAVAAIAAFDLAMALDDHKPVG